MVAKRQSTIQQFEFDSELSSLLAAARNGDKQAIGDLLEPHRERLHRYFVKRVRTPDDADTLVQRSFLAAINALPGFRGDCPFERWLWRIAAHECVRYYKQKAKASAEVSFEELSESGGGVQHLTSYEPLLESEDRAVAQILLESARKWCSPAEFQVMMLFYRTESFDEVADLLDMNAATARSHFLRGRANLLAHLILEQPEMLGGVEAVRQSIESSRAAESFSDAEIQALSNPATSSKAFRSACIKVARHLPTEGLL